MAAAAAALAVVLFGVAVPAFSQVEFPGPETVATASEALSAISLPLEPGESEFLVGGGANGALDLYRYFEGAERILSLDRFFVGGRLVDLIPWEGRPLLDQGLVAATADPDRVVFIRVQPQSPYFTVEQVVELEEDPGTMSFVGEIAGGVPELAVSLPGIDQLALLREEEGLWNVAAVLDTGDRPQTIAGLDLDGDLVRELVTANRGPLSGNLGIFKRDPEGVYVGTQQDFTPGTPTDLSTFDLDGDGRLELAVTVAGVPEVVLFSEAAGQLVPGTSVALTLPADGIHLTALFDGSVGLIASNGDRGLVEFHRLEGGSWRRVKAYYPGCHPLMTTSGDLNGDGGRDLISAGGDDRRLTVMFANSQPGFWGYPALALSARPGSSEIADFDGDGLVDLVVANSDLPQLSLFRGLAGGGFDPTPAGSDLTFYPGMLAVLDSDADPAVELAILDGSGDRVVVADYVPGQGFVPVSGTPTGIDPFFLISRDLDDDGSHDLVAITRESEEITLLFGAGDSSFPARTNLGLDNGADWITPLDLDADGLLDLVCSDGVNRVWTTLNGGDRTFGNLNWMNAGSGPGYMAAGDLDGDGDEDLVVANRIDESLSMFENTGSGALTRRIGAHALTSYPEGLVVRNMDGDELPEIVLNLREDGVMGISYPLATWTYSLVSTYSGSPDAAEFRVADFNLDGVPDILTLDGSLRLGLTMLNVEQILVAVEPDALAVECGDRRLVIRVRPDRAGPWTVALESSDGWIQLGDTGSALIGDMAFDRGTWILTVDRGELGGLRALNRLRLTVGEGLERETLELDLREYCPAGAAGELPRVAWAREPWPNPFNPLVNASFSLGRGADVTVGVYDLAGRRVSLLADGWHEAGEHPLRWDGRSNGRPAAAGVYLLRISTPQDILIHKVMLLK